MALGFTLVILVLLSTALECSGIVSDSLDAGIETQNVKAGKSLAMSCNIRGDVTEDLDCRWVAPDGQLYHVKNGNVTDVNGDLAAGLNSFSRDDANTCSIFVQKLPSAQLGTWSCTLSQAGKPFRRAFLSPLPVGQRVTQGLRLPGTWLPDNYKLQLVPNFAPAFTIDGLVKATLVSTSDSSEIFLHAKAMTVFEDGVDVRGSNWSSVSIAGFGYDDKRDFFIVYLADSAPANTRLTVAIPYEGQLSDNLSGFYRSSYERDGETHWLAITQFEATDARKAFPCMDEPAMKAVFWVTLGRPQLYSTASNMPIELAGLQLDPPKDGYVKDVFTPTKRMSSYLVAFLVSDFTFRSSYTDVRRAFRIWARDDLFEQTNYASETGPAVLDYYETYFGVTFPLPKQDMAAIPDFNAGAMENWGLVTYREADLLYETGVSSLKNRNRIAEIVSHELAHQWFGDLVTMEWWSDLWLNEGFASYVAYIGQDHVDPESAPQDRFVLENNQFAFSLDATVSSHPVVSEVVNPVDIGLIFDEISYQKGAAIIRMLEKLIGTETFNKGLKNYLVSNAYDNAVQDDLWEKLTDAAHEDETLSDELTVKAIMDTWTRQMGFPVITVKEGKDPNTVVLSQERFLIGSSNETALYTWWVPYTFTQIPGGNFEDTTNHGFLTPDGENATIDVDGSKAIIINVLQTNYYRVNYPKENWLAIASSLIENVESVHKINRAQIIDDALNIAKAGLLEYDTGTKLSGARFI